MSKKFTLAEVLLIFLMAGRLFSQDFNYISAYDGQGTPLDMVNTDISESLINNINASFPEGFPVPEYNAEYIANGVETNVVITELADVWVTFVGEGAGYRNVLGFYTYDLSSPYASQPQDEDITIIFPNVSAIGSGGGLSIGDKMYLGQFPPNTGIGWVLIANGWNGSQVTNGNWTLFSDPHFNPENSAELQKHNVNLFDDNEQVVVFGFEDIRRDNSSCDQDFNDALFLVTSNPYTAIDKSNYNGIATDGGAQSSGNDGGLESNRGLSSTIAKRSFNRSTKEYQNQMNTVVTRSTTLLSSLVPSTLKENDVRSISSPSDLESITKADEVWSADFMDANDQCFATVFATRTDGQIYDHTKVVCDRLAGSQVIDIKEVMIDENKFLLSTLRTPSNSLEYSISFSLEVNDNSECTLSSKWTVDQYSFGEEFLNYQIWTSAPFLTKDIAKKIISKVQEDHILHTTTDTVSFKPVVFIEQGFHTIDGVEFDLNNTSNDTLEVYLVGSSASSELDTNLEPYAETLLLPPGVSTHIVDNSEVGIYDLEVKVSTDSDTQYDVAYFADGAWGIDYSSEQTEIKDFDISRNNATRDMGYSIARNIMVEYESEDYISVYRHLKPSGGYIDLSEYNTLEFESNITSPVTIRLIKKGILDWNEQFTYVLRPTGETDTHVVPFSYFRNSKEEILNPEDIQMVVFTQDSKLGFDSVLEFNNLNFNLRSDIQSTITSELSVYPNPSSGNVKLSFDSPLTRTAVLRVVDILGREVLKEEILINKGVNTVYKNLEFLEKGSHMISISEGRQSLFIKKFIKI